MKATTRRNFLKGSITAGAALGMPRIIRAAQTSSNDSGPGNTVRVGVIGLGDTTAVGGVGGRGHQLIPRLREVAGVKITALCDVDQRFLDREAQPFKDRGEAVATFRDIRKLLEDKNIDAVVIALPNHWHALATVWACEAGKDVYVEKPFSHDIWEGQQMVAAGRKYGRMVQVGTQNRSSTFLPEAFEYLRSGELGRIRYGHTLVYRPRTGIGKVSAPTAIPSSVDYDLWCGPAPKQPLMRKQLNYEWHWFWDTGNGEIGNNGVHVMDLCRWALGQNQAPPRAMSIGGRFGFDDCGETANTQIALLDYQPAPMICEIRNVSVAKDSIGKFRNRNGGLLIDCEGGYFAGDASGGAIYDRQDKKIKDMPEDGSSKKLETMHLSHFVDAVRSRKSTDLAADATEGHLSAVCCHLPNISHRLGAQASPESIKEKTGGTRELSDAFERCREYLRENGVDLNATPAVLGPWLTFDPKQEQFTGEFAAQANALARREYRPPFVLPKVV
jgi:predicted dehydrogenase